MTALAESIALYRRHDLELAVDLHHYLHHGLVVVTPSRVLLARPVRKDSWVEGSGYGWLRPDEEADTWWVKFAFGKGAMRWFVDQAPYYLPHLAWSRDFGRDKTTRPRVYRTERLSALLGATHSKS